MSTPERLLEIHRHDGPSYKPLVDFESWRVAVLNFSPDLLPEMAGSALLRALEHGWQRDAATQTPWYQFRARDGFWQGWFDDPVSLRRRLDYLARGRFGGVAFFVLGYDGGVLVRVAREAFKRSGDRPRNGRPEFVR